jgi:predicted GTPase
VLIFIDNFYKMHESKDRDEKRALLKAELADKIVMTNYGKHQYYKIIDLSFKKAEEIMLDEKTDMLKYYKDRYGITVTKASQPLLEVEGRRGKKGE